VRIRLGIEGLDTKDFYISECNLSSPSVKDFAVAHGGTMSKCTPGGTDMTHDQKPPKSEGLILGRES
jgi:hypothetical protein